MAWDYYGRLWADAKLDIVFGQLPILLLTKTIKFGKVVQ
tara:strand:- start:59 stop:175 length:117 start_codon:yes stop_codon:yes gene_type:complete